MNNTINSRRCKKVKFKRNNEESALNGSSSCNEQNHNSIIIQNCQSCSFSKLLTFLLLLSFYTIETQSKVVDDLYRSRSKRYVEQQGEDVSEVLTNRPDTVCNQGGNHECVCNRSLGDLDDKLMLCDRLLEEKHLMAVSLIMRNINLDVKLHTNEPYQQYLRRRIANIVSQYCEHQANECPGAILSLNRNNVIILRVNYLARQRTEIQIVVAKESMPKKLNEATLIDSKKVKNILGAQLAPLSRVLGGVLIEKLRLVEVDRRKPTGQNNGLIKLLFIIGLCMGFCYAIACAKVCRDTWRRRQAKKDDVMLAEDNKRNYGTCTDKLLSTCEAPNGKVKSKSITSRTSVISTTKDRRTSSDRRSTTRSSKRSNNNNEDLTSITIDINRQDISQPETSPASCATDSRSFQRMFACDLSQLPAESCDLIDDQDPDAVFFEDGDAVELATNQTSPKYNNGFAHNYVENVEIHNVSMENTPNVNKRPPIVPIVIASGSQFSIDKEPPPALEEKHDFEVPVIDTKSQYMHQDSTDSVGINQYFDSAPQQKSPLLTLIQEDPFKRPLSRRGSRDINSPVEDGAEEFDDNASTDSLPLGDRDNESLQNIPSTSKNPEITFEQSSSDESEDETNELYHKLNEEEENEGNKEKMKNAKSDEHYSSESDDEQLNENIMLDRHAYERLEESPLPSPSIYTNNNSVPNKNELLKKKSMEEVVNDLAERVPSDYEEEDLR